MHCISGINIGKTYFAMGDFEKALNTSRESLDLSKELEYPRAIIESLTVIVKSLEKIRFGTPRTAVRVGGASQITWY